MIHRKAIKSIKTVLFLIAGVAGYLLAPEMAQAACTINPPTVTYSPDPAYTCMNPGNVAITVTITNMDQGNPCSPATFNVAITGNTNSNFSTNLSGGSVGPLNRGSSANLTLTVSPNGTQVNGNSTAVTITATEASHPNGSGNISVTIQHPTGINFNPTSGSIGTPVTVTGAGFGGTQGAGTVQFFNGVTATATVWSDTSISVTVPSGATTGPVTVTNDIGCSNTSAGNFTVSAANQRPGITSTPPGSATESALYSYNITASDPESDAITLAKSAGDTCNGVLTDNGNGTGLYTFTPNENQGGTTCVVGVVASDAGGAGTPQNTTINIIENNITPVVGGDTALNGTVGVPLNVNVSATDTDLPSTIPEAQVRVEQNGGTCTGTPTGLPTAYGNGTFTGTFSYTPQVADGVSCTIIYRACDQGTPVLCSSNRTLTLTMDINDPPTISGTTTVTVAEGATTSSLTITGSDVDTCSGPGSFGYVTLSRTGGTCTGAVTPLPSPSCSPSTGTYTYTALAEEPQISCTLIFRATDGGGLQSTDLTVVVSITEVNAAPSVGGDTSACGTVGNPTTINVSGTDPDRPTSLTQSQVRVELSSSTCRNAPVGLPTNYGSGSITGSFTLTLHNLDGAGCSINYRACDQAGLCSGDRTVNISSGPCGNTPPTISGTTAITVAEGSVSGNLTVTGSDGNTCAGAGDDGYVTVSRVGGTCTGAVSALPAPACNTSSGTYTYTAIAEELNSSCTIILRATDGGGLTSADLTATVTITEVNVAPTVAGDITASGSVGNPVTINVSGADSDRPTSLAQAQVRIEQNGGTCSGTPVGLPTSYGAGSFTGSFSYTPQVADSPSCTIVYRACDQGAPSLCSANRTVTVSVGGACAHAIPGVTVSPPATQQVCRSSCANYTFTVTNNDSGGGCPDETYNLTYSPPPDGNWYLSSPPASVVVAAGATSGGQTLPVCTNASASGTWNNFRISAISQSGNDSTGFDDSIVTSVDMTMPVRIYDIAQVAGDAQVTLSWTNSTDYAEVLIKRKTGSFPTGHTDGSAVTVLDDASPAAGPANFVNNTGLTNGTTYFYAIYVKDACGNWNDQTVEWNNAIRSTPQSSSPDSLSVTNAGTPPCCSLDVGVVNKVVLAIRFTAGSKSVTISRIGVQKTGTTVDLTDIAKVTFWTDDNNDGFIYNETLLGQATWDGATYYLDNMFFTVVAGTPRTVLVVVDISPGANVGRTATFTMDDGYPGYLAVRSPDTINTINPAITNGPFTITAPAVAGDGNLLRRTNENETAAKNCSACHDLLIHNSSNVSSSYWSGNWGSTFTCQTCHTPHNTTNIYLVVPQMVWSEPGVKSINSPVVLRTLGIGDPDNPSPTPGVWSGQLADANDGVYTGICEVCHTVTNQHRNAAGAPVTTHHNSEICTGCHTHVDGFGGGGESGGGSQCSGCHSNTWNRLNGTATTTISGATIVSRHAIGGVAGTNDSPNQSSPNASWNTDPLNVVMSFRSCTNMCHPDHPHDQMGTHQANLYENPIDSSASGRGMTNGAMATDFDSALGNYGLCITCHSKGVDATHKSLSGAAYDASAHNFTSANGVDYEYVQHDSGVTTKNCTKCHHDPDDTLAIENTTPFAGVHYSRFDSLLFGTVRGNNYTPSLICYGCHNGTNATDLISIFGTNTGSGKTGGKAYTHKITIDSTHDTVAEYNAPNMQGVARHTACVDCHSPHQAQNGTYTPGQTVTIPKPPPLTGIWGVAANYAGPTTTYVKKSPIDYEYELCLKCHSSYGWSTAPLASPGPNNQNWQETNVGQDFNPNNLSYHPLFAPGKNRPPAATLANTRDLTPPTSNKSWWTDGNGSAARKHIAGQPITDNPGVTVYNDLSNTFVDGWQYDSYVTCSDCHGNDVATGVRGPHGSANKWILKGIDPNVTVTLVNGSVTYPNQGSNVNSANFCLNCHRRDVYGDNDGTTATPPAGAAQYLSRKQHQNNAGDFGINADGGTRFDIPCLNCHGGMSPGQIHGSNLGQGTYPATCNAGENCNRGFRFMNGSSWNGHMIYAGGGTCWTIGSANDVSQCTHHSAAKGTGYTDVNYRYL